MSDVPFVVAANKVAADDVADARRACACRLELAEDVPLLAVDARDTESRQGRPARSALPDPRQHELSTWTPRLVILLGASVLLVASLVFFVRRRCRRVAAARAGSGAGMVADARPPLDLGTRSTRRRPAAPARPRSHSETAGDWLEERWPPAPRREACPVSSASRLPRTRRGCHRPRRLAATVAVPRRPTQVAAAGRRPRRRSQSRAARAALRRARRPAARPALHREPRHRPARAEPLPQPVALPAPEPARSRPQPTPAPTAAQPRARATEPASRPSRPTAPPSRSRRRRPHRRLWQPRPSVGTRRGRGARCGGCWPPRAHAAHAPVPRSTAS